MSKLVHAQKLNAPAAWRWWCMGAAEWPMGKAVYITHVAGPKACLWQVVGEISVSHLTPGHQEARALCNFRAFGGSREVCRLPGTGACLLVRRNSLRHRTVSYHEVPRQVPCMTCSSCNFEFSPKWRQHACQSTTETHIAAEQVGHLYRGVQFLHPPVMLMPDGAKGASLSIAEGPEAACNLAPCP